MVKTITVIKNIEKKMGFQTELKWKNIIFISGFHVFGIYWSYLFAFPVKWQTILLVFLTYTFNGISIVCGAHRLWAHRSFKATLPLRIYLMLGFACSGQNALYDWIHTHRLHHKYSDTEADPHNSNRGFFYSHIGWLLMKKNDIIRQKERLIDMSDIKNDAVAAFHRKMARPKPPERKIGNHTEEQMRLALQKIKAGESIRKVAKSTKIPFTTLRRYFLKQKNNTLHHLTPNYEVNKIFTDEQEAELKRYYLYCSSIFYGLTTKECRKIAFEMALKNNLKMPESWKKNCMAGKDWLKLFRSRHPELSLRSPEPCSMARATAFNQSNVNKFYNNLEDLLKRSPNFKDGTRIFNLDETATTTVQKPQKVIAKKGNRGVGKITSGEKGTLVTTCCIISASGTAMPPVLVFPRKNFKDHMLKNTPTGTLGLAAPSGWMNSELFIEVMKHFIKHSNSSKENPTILVMDNHESHISVEALNLAKDSGVHVITLHPHTSGKLQPLDVGIYGPFKTYYNGCMDSWMLHHPGKQVTIYDVGEIVGSAFMKAMTPSNITNAFKKCGIFPFDRNRFTEEDFMPSTVTDRPCTDCEQRNIEPTRNQAFSGSNASTSNVTQDNSGQDNEAFENTEPVPSISPQDAEIPLTLNNSVPECHNILDEFVDMDVNDESPKSPSLLQDDTQKGNANINSSVLEANIVTTTNINTPVVIQNNQSNAENVVLAYKEAEEIVNAIETGAGPSSPGVQIENNKKNQSFISPFQFRDPIKAGPRQNKRKPRKLGRILYQFLKKEKS